MPGKIQPNTSFRKTCCKKQPKYEVCQKSFGKEKILKRHMLSHSHVKPFTCEICGKDFILEDDLNQHKNVHVYTQDKPFVCEKCKKSFGSKFNLKQHMLIHSGERPFVCGICRKGFVQKHHLKAHGTVHTGEKPFVCEKCDKRFCHKATLTRHLLIHGGNKPFSCKICEKKFLEKGNLRQHMLVHNRVKSNNCKIREQNFTGKDRLNEHRLLTPSDEHPLKCKICKKKNPFRSQSDFNRHMAGHTSGKLFICKICKMSHIQKKRIKHTYNCPHSSETTNS